MKVPETAGGGSKPGAGQIVGITGKAEIRNPIGHRVIAERWGGCQNKKALRDRSTEPS